MPEETIAGPKYSTSEYSINSKLMAKYELCSLAEAIQGNSLKETEKEAIAASSTFLAGQRSHDPHGLPDSDSGVSFVERVDKNHN